MERNVAVAACERVDIAGDVAVAIPTGSACWVVRLLMLYLSDRPTSDCFRGLVGDAVDTIAFPAGRRGQSGQGVDSRRWHM